MDNKILLAFVSALLGGVVAHMLAVWRERRTHRRDQLFEFAERLGVVELLGTRLAFALDEGDETRVNELRWQVSEQLYPLLVYAEIHRFHTTDLRDAMRVLIARLTLLHSWKEIDDPATIDAEGPLHYWQQGDPGTILFEAMKKEFKHVL